MKKGIVKFSKEFVTPIGTKEWVGIEMEYDMGTECPRDVLTNAKTIVEQWHKGNNPDPAQLAPSTELPVINKPYDRQIGITPEDILSSPDLVVLGTYQWIIKGKPELERAYMLRYDELSKQTQ